MTFSQVNKTLLNKPNIEVKKISTKPRENMYIEILRFVSLMALIIIHTGALAGISQFSEVVNTLTLGTGQSFDIHFFCFITGIYTVGKGKVYFLRNLSRNLLVFTLLASIYLPIYLTTKVDYTSRNFTWNSIIIQGSLWYLWAITIASLFLPLIKLDFLRKFNVIFSIILIPIFLGLSIVFGWTFASPLRVGFIALAGYLSTDVFNRWNYKHKRIVTLIVSLILLVAIFGLVYVETYKVNSVIFLKFRVFYVLVTCAIIISLIASLEKKTPKKIDWLIKNSYFIYEFHHLFQVLWSLILINIPSEYNSVLQKVQYSNEGWLILSWVFVFTTSILTSFVVTKIQYKLWEKFVGKLLYKITPYSPLYIFIALLFIIAHILNVIF